MTYFDIHGLQLIWLSCRWQAWREDGVDVYVPPVKEELKSPLTQQDIKDLWWEQGYRFKDSPGSKGGPQKFMIGELAYFYM